MSDAAPQGISDPAIAACLRRVNVVYMGGTVPQALTRLPCSVVHVDSVASAVEAVATHTPDAIVTGLGASASQDGECRVWCCATAPCSAPALHDTGHHHA